MTSAATSSRRDLIRGVAWISPWLAGFVVFLAVPVALSLWYSLTDYTLIERPVWLGLGNYRELLSDASFASAVRNTLIFSLLHAAGSTALSLAIALLLETKLRGAALVRALVFLPTIVPVVSGCITWMWLMNPEFGFLNSALAMVGIDGPNWLGSRATALPSLVLMSLWVIGGPMLVCSAALRAVPRELHEASAIDGVSGPGRLRHVTLPMISPAVMFNAVMAVIWSVQLFAPPLIMTPRGMEDATGTVSVFVYTNGFAYGRMGYACAAAWIQIVVTLALVGMVLGVGRRFTYCRAA
jgi:multiple sugar transport system permease protein